jgi:hypothetical protein
MGRSWYRIGALLTLLVLVSCGTPVASPTAGSASRPLAPSATFVVSASPVTSATPTRLATPSALPATPATPRPAVTPAAIPTAVGTPVVTTISREGVIVELRLTKTSFAAGEGGPASVIVRNTGTTPVLLLGGCTWSTVLVLDEQGQFVAPPEWFTGAISCPGLQRPLAPGAEERTTVWFQVPPDSAGRRYALQAQVGLGAPPSPGINITGQPLTTTPLPLTITAPTPAQHLRVTLGADRAGWRFIATDQSGQAPPAPHWLQVEAGVPMTTHRNWLGDSPDGCWAGGWGDGFRDDANAPITVRVWLAVPGYVVATATQVAPSGSGTRLFPRGTPASRCVDPNATP